MQSRVTVITRCAILSAHLRHPPGNLSAALRPERRRHPQSRVLVAAPAYAPLDPPRAKGVLPALRPGRHRAGRALGPVAASCGVFGTFRVFSRPGGTIAPRRGMCQMLVIAWYFGSAVRCSLVV